MNSKRYLCCCCCVPFDSIKDIEDHSYQKFLLSHSESYDICGSDIWFCFGCLKYFRGFENYKNHFKCPDPCLIL